MDSQLEDLGRKPLYDCRMTVATFSQWELTMFGSSPWTFKGFWQSETQSFGWEFLWLSTALQYHKFNRWFSHLRKQHVTMNGFVSKRLFFDLRVIQGTLSGPWFFIYYINGLFTDTQTTRHSSFADETTIATIWLLDTGDESYQSLCSVIEGCQMWKLSLNIGKCRELLVQFRKGHVECLTNIPRCDSLKLLGVHIQNPIWEYFIEMQTNKIPH